MLNEDRTSGLSPSKSSMEQLNQQQVRQLASSSQKAKLENSFAAHWALLYAQLPEPVRQYRFADGRKFAFDFAWALPDMRLAVEIVGGAYMARSGHNSAAGMAKDYEKHNLATRLGWKVLYFSTPMLQDMTSVVTEVAEVLCNAKEI